MLSRHARRAAGPAIDRRSRVLALVPHYRCEEWLGECLESLCAQTRPLEGIAVIDDASEVSPLKIVRRFPGVTLLRADENVGPYRLIQSVIEATRYDAYLFNDADDWSAPRRLELLLAEAERSGAELVGSQEVRVLCEEGEALAFEYPLDVNRALLEEPCGFPLLHPTSLIARSLVMRIGGFATGLRFSGDAELLRRAAHAARAVNVPEHLYFRRKRPGALTTAPETGLSSPARLELQQVLWRRARENAARIRAGAAADLAPLTRAGPVGLEHLLGPSLVPPPRARGPWPRLKTASPARFDGCGGAVSAPASPPRAASPPGPAAAPVPGSLPGPTPAGNGVAPAARAAEACREGDGTPSGRASARAARGFGRPEHGAARGRAERAGSPDPVQRPVFVIGPPRSGASLLAWSLGQHPGLATCLPGEWLSGLAGRLHLLAESVERPGGRATGERLPQQAAFRGALAAAVARLRAPAPTHRWIDYTPENAFHVYGLHRLFPHARFLHVVRPVDEVVDSLTRIAAPDGCYYTEESAAERWLRTVRAGLAAEEALGSGLVLRVAYEELLREPETVVRRCLAHLGEEFEPGCLRPLRTLGVRRVPAPAPEGAPRIREEARRFQAGLAPAAALPAGCTARLAELARAYAERFGEGSLEPGEVSPVRWMREVVRAAVAPESTVLVVSRGDEGLLELPGVRGWHFPRAEDGRYAGHHPADSEEAIAHLERQRALGAEFLLFPVTAFWWLEFYPDFRTYLEGRYRVIAYQENACLVYALRGGGSPAVDLASATLAIA